jgi:tRNA(Arg) A34 adenosine deaminase TadA
MENPLWHGEVHCLKRFYEMPKADRPDAKDCVFIATHEPCSLCLSAITWTGLRQFLLSLQPRGFARLLPSRTI